MRRTLCAPYIVPVKIRIKQEHIDYSNICKTQIFSAYFSVIFHPDFKAQVKCTGSKAVRFTFRWV